MGIFDRLGRVARSEVSEMKRVLREGRRDRGGALASDDPWDDQLSYEADIAAADAELARDLGDPLSDAFAREFGAGPTAVAARGLDDDMARGASLWGAPAPSSAPLPRDPTFDARPVNPGWIEVAPPAPGPANPNAAPNPWAQPTATEPARPTEARPGRTETFPREVREAYAVLELPLGADRSRIDQAFRGLVQRYHPDHHAGQPELQRTAAELTIRLTDARELLYAWLEGRR